MKTAKAIVLSIAILIIVGCNQSKNGDFSDPQERKIENLKVFSKLYGYIRYFHPSDEAASLNWDKFLYYGIEQVIKDQNSVDLMNTLDSLFLPIAPSIDIFFEGETPKVIDQPENIDDLVLVTWQHKGIGIWKNSIYNSIRLGRTDWSENRKYGIYQHLEWDDFGNKKFKLSAKVRTEENSKGEIEIVAYTSMGTYDLSKTFYNEEWEQLILENVFEDDTYFVTVEIRLLGKGKVWIDDIEFQLEKSEGEFQPFSISNYQFNSQDQGGFPAGWEIYGFGYEYSIEKSESRTSLVIQNSDDFKYNSLFKEHAKGSDLITKDLGSGIKCRFPIGLYLPREQPDNFSESFRLLENKLAQIQIEENTIQQEATRIGAVIIAWNIFQHFYPYFDVVQTDWDSVLAQTLINVQDVRDENDCVITLHQMTAALHDGHANVIHPVNRKLKALPARFDYIETQILVVSSNSDQLLKGDILLEIDGKPAKQILFERQEVESGSPQWKRHRSLTNFTLKDSSEVSELKIERDGQILNVSVDRKSPVPGIERPGNVTEIENNIYYVDLQKATIEEIDNQIQEIAKAKGVVFDMRGYPNGNHDVISYMIDHPVRSAKWNIPQIIYPDQESIVGYDTLGRWTIEHKQPMIQGKIIFLTDKSAISYAESFMGIIEHYKLAEIIGSPTAGTNGNVNTVTTMGGFWFNWTGMKVLKHDGSQHHLVGILPTIPMEPTIKGIREGRDELLEKAIEIISK